MEASSAPVKSPPVKSPEQRSPYLNLEEKEDFNLLKNSYKDSNNNPLMNSNKNSNPLFNSSKDGSNNNNNPLMNSNYSLMKYITAEPIAVLSDDQER